MIKSDKLKCPVCNSEVTKDGNTTESTLLRCPKCTHCYSKVHAEPETYSPEYFSEKHKNWFKHQMYEYYDKLYNILITNENIKLMDVGCGQGQFLKYFHKKI